MNAATADGTLYHGRVLDYGVDLRLQEHAVLIVAEPTGGIPFVNVSYAGFIGSTASRKSSTRFLLASAACPVARSAVSGVRSSCDAFAVNRRICSNDDSSFASVALKACAI
jgi:hypothetical protein